MVGLTITVTLLFCVNAVRSVEVEFELERTPTKWVPSWKVELLATMSPLATSSSTTSLRVERIFTLVICGTHVRICEDLLSCRNIHEFLLRSFLVLLVLKFVGMPLHSQFLISLINLFLSGATLDPEYFIIIPFPRLLLQLFSYTFLRSGEPFLLLQCCSVVIQSLIEHVLLQEGISSVAVQPWLIIYLDSLTTSFPRLYHITSFPLQ